MFKIKIVASNKEHIEGIKTSLLCIPADIDIQSIVQPTDPQALRFSSLNSCFTYMDSIMNEDLDEEFNNMDMIVQSVDVVFTSNRHLYGTTVIGCKNGNNADHRLSTTGLFQISDIEYEKLVNNEKEFSILDEGNRIESLITATNNVRNK